MEEQKAVRLRIAGAVSMTSSAALNALVNLQPLGLFIRNTAMRATHRLIRLDLWGNKERERHSALEGLFGKLNPLFIVPSDSRLPIQPFDRRCDVILKRKENCDDSEGCVSGYTDVFCTYGSKTEQGYRTGVYLWIKSEKWAFPPLND